jgi:AraC-like DNA-binding protein
MDSVPGVSAVLSGVHVAGVNAGDVLGAYASALRSFLTRRGLISKPASKGRSWDAATRESATRFSGTLLGASLCSGDTLLGLRFAREIDFDRFGLLGVTAAMAPTLRHALGVLVSCKASMSRLGAVQVHRRGAYLDIEWLARPGIPDIVSATALAGWLGFARHIADEAVPVEFIRLPTVLGHGAGSLESVIDAPVRHDAQCHSLRIHRDALDLPSRLAAPELFASLLPWLRRDTHLLESDRDGWLAFVRDRLVGLWQHHGGASELDLSTSLGISRRSLQRRITERTGLTFCELRDTLRVAASVAALTTSSSRQTDIGTDVGFVEHSSFSRAVREWLGVAPSAVRSWALRSNSC